MSTPAEVHFVALTPALLDAVLAVEVRAYAHPWNRSNYQDALQSGNQAQVLMADGVVVGYFVAMLALDEVHLLNITVAPEYQGQGWAQVMLEAMCLWARGQAAQTAWLEVRVGNARALRAYEKHGFTRVGMRKQYYPAHQGAREDAVVMRMCL